VYAQSPTSHMKATVVHGGKTSLADGCEDDDKEKEPQRHSKQDRRLPIRPTSSGSRPIFTQQQLDIALYGGGHSTCDITPSTVSLELCRLRPAGLSYGNPYFIVAPPCGGLIGGGH